MTQPSTELDGPPGAGPVRWFAGAAAVLAAVFCVLGFLGGVGVSDLAGVLVVGGGLLAGTVALPKAGRVLAPSLVAVTLGVLMLLQAIMTSRVTALLAAALVVAFVEMVAVVGAVLVDLGVVARHAERPAVADPDALPVAQWNPSSVMGPAAADPTMTYVGSFGGPPSTPGFAPAEPPAAVPAPPTSDVFPVGPSGALPRYGLSTPSGPPERAAEAVPRLGPAGPDHGWASGPAAAASNGSGDTTTAVPRYGLPPTGPAGPGGASSLPSEFNGRVNGGVVPHTPSPVSAEQPPTAVHPATNGVAPGYSTRAPGEPEQAGEAIGSGSRPGFSPSGVPLGAAPAVNGSVLPPAAESPAGAGAPQLAPPSSPSPAPRTGTTGSTGDGAIPRNRFRAGAPGGAPAAAGSAEPGASREDPPSLRLVAPSDVSATLPTHGPPSAGPGAASGSGPSGAHRAPAAEQSPPSTPVPSPGRSTGRAGAHRAPSPDVAAPDPAASATSVFALSEAGPPVSRDRSTPGAPAPARPGAGDDALPRRRSSPAGPSSGYHTPPPFGSFEDRSLLGSAAAGRPTGGGAQSSSDLDQVPGGLFQPAPRGGASHPGLSPSDPAAEPRPARPDPTPATTVFRAQPASNALDATPAWGHGPSEGGHEPDAGPPSWLGSGPGPAAPEVPSRRLPSGEHRRGADGRREQSDHADPEATRLFPTAER